MVWYHGTLPTKVYALSTQKFFLMLELEKKIEKKIVPYIQKRPNPENEKKNSPFPQFLTGREAVQGSSSPDTLKVLLVQRKAPLLFFRPTSFA